ncbi:hypothetical protein [Paenibacillus herberti]|uniref:hypothetical protein n=1 Tax=Paenibacillus herberti TaxID=1619309 RepID=UPI00159548BD|nr:hypothetical protein [Paenibacillus herberti]
MDTLSFSISAVLIFITTGFLLLFITHFGGKPDFVRFSLALYIDKFDIPNTTEIKEFIQRGYLDVDDELNFIPTGWTLEDELKNSLVLRFFSNFVPCITLAVDVSNNQVVMIQLSGD